MFVYWNGVMFVQFEHLKYFRAVADHKSITKASAALFCAQPTISSAIKSIETELGYPIIERSATGVNLTDLGRRLYDDAGIILDTYQRWLDMAEESSLYHPVTITMTGTVPSFYVIRAIDEVQQKLPDLSIDIKFKHEPDALEAQVSGRLSIQYKIPNHLNNTIEFARRHGLRLALLQEDSFSVFVNSASPLADREELELSDLLDQKLYIYQNAKRFPYIRQLNDAGIKVHSQMFYEDSLMVTVSLIKDACAIRPNKIATHDPYITQGIIRRIPFKGNPFPCNLYVSYPDEKHIYESERLFIESLMASFPSFTPIEIDTQA